MIVVCKKKKKHLLTCDRDSVSAEDITLPQSAQEENATRGILYFNYRWIIVGHEIEPKWCKADIFLLNCLTFFTHRCRYQCLKGCFKQDMLIGIDLELSPPNSNNSVFNVNMQIQI